MLSTRNSRAKETRFFRDTTAYREKKRPVNKKPSKALISILSFGA